MARHAAPRQPDARKFRPEIEGLRAVAAMLVAVYHIWFAKVSGGVDVFFLIAGFLITTSLLGQVARSGRVDVSHFLSRLAKRLLPASLTVLLAVLVATKLWMPISREDATYSEIVASALYLENWALARQSIDYLAREEASSPVQHFWAMSIQGQFYLIWLLVFVFALWIGRGRIRTLLVGLMAGLFIVSLAFSIHLTSSNQPLAYFHTGTRVWEFAAGGLLALGVSRLRQWPLAWGALTSWLGLLMIIVTGFALPVSDSFPGVAALWPITGAALVLFGSGSQSPLGANVLLSSRPFVYFGGISYGFYLWHWPILTFYLLWTGNHSAGVISGLAIIGSSVVLAIITTRVVEQPVRSGRAFDATMARMFPLKRWAVPTAAVMSMLVVAGSTIGVSSYVSRDSADVLSATEQDHPGAAAMQDPRGAAAEYSVPPIPGLAQAAEDRAEVSLNGCHQGLTDPEVIACEYGDPDAEVTVWLVGGSHSAHWFPTMELITEARGWRLVSATKSSCLFSMDPPGSGAQLESCVAWNEALFEMIVEEAPDLVVMTSTRGQGEAEHVPDGYIEWWTALEREGIDIAAIRDTPRFGSSRIDCLAQHGIDSDGCDEARALHLADEAPTTALNEDLSNVSFIDLSEYFCDKDTCYTVIGNVVVYYDAHHITATYARTVAPMLDAELSRILE